MQLTEAEIAKLITLWVGVRLQYPMDEPPEPEEWPMATIFNMDKAAHAIAEAEAEKMREEVVWESVGMACAADDPDTICIQPCTREDDWELWVVGKEPHPLADVLNNGKHLRVTVTKLEGEDGQGMD